VDKDGLLTRKEHQEEQLVDPFLLRDEDAVVIGEHTCRTPFRVKGLVGQSAMSFGALGENAITALSKGLGLAKGTWMNTGEGGLSFGRQPGYHYADWARSVRSEKTEWGIFLGRVQEKE
jgi:glutamate synthase domain-containing protein 2